VACGPGLVLSPLAVKTSEFYVTVRTTWSKKQSNDAALFGALVGGFFGAASAPAHAPGDQAFAQGLLGAASGAAGMAALESVLNGPTKSKASAKQSASPVNKTIAKTASKNPSGAACWSEIKSDKAGLLLKSAGMSRNVNPRPSGLALVGVFPNASRAGCTVPATRDERIHCLRKEVKKGTLGVKEIYGRAVQVPPTPRCFRRSHLGDSVH
jgi:hypothetical protein